MTGSPTAPTPFNLMTKPRGAICNLDCTYCYFLEKEHLYPDSPFRMADEVLESYVRQFIAAQPGDQVTFAWQGGEPTLMGLEFFERAVELQQQYARPRMQISNALQTNGTLLDEGWCRFFKQHDFLIGLSIDGPQPLHDAYRVNKGGEGTFAAVRRAWELLQRFEIPTNILCTVHPANQDYPLEVYRFFRDELGAEFIQFIPIVERNLPRLTTGGIRLEEIEVVANGRSPVTPWTVDAGAYGRFLSTIFDEWVRQDVGRIFVQLFDVTLGAWLGQPGGLCIFAPTCGAALALEHTGDVYSCDHYVDPDYLLGNLQQTPLAELVASERQQQFGEAKLTSLPTYCQQCEVRFACHGGCPKNRFIETPDGEPGLNYLCVGYKQFFTHVAEPMEEMAALLRNGRSPADIMPRLAAREQARFAQAGRNDPCPCGSGKKFKRCHGRPQASIAPSL